MKGVKFLVAMFIIAFLIAIPIVINDAVKGQGFFMTTATYRDYIQQGK